MKLPPCQPARCFPPAPRPGPRRPCRFRRLPGRGGSNVHALFSYCKLKMHRLQLLFGFALHFLVLLSPNSVLSPKRAAAEKTRQPWACRYVKKGAADHGSSAVETARAASTGRCFSHSRGPQDSSASMANTAAKPTVSHRVKGVPSTSAASSAAVTGSEKP